MLTIAIIGTTAAIELVLVLLLERATNRRRAGYRLRRDARYTRRTALTGGQ